MSKRKLSEEEEEEEETEELEDFHLEKKVKPNEPSFLGRLYWHGEDEHVDILQDSQIIMVQDMQLEVHVESDGDLELIYYEQIHDQKERHQDVLDHLKNQLDMRKQEMRHHERLVSQIGARLKQDEISDNEVNELLRQQNDHLRIVRNHAIQIKRIHAKTVVHVNFELKTRTLRTKLKPGQMLLPDFLPKTVCWLPDGMTFEVQTDATETITHPMRNVISYGLNEADCEWLEQHRFNAPIDIQRIKVPIYRHAAACGNAFGQSLLGRCHYWGWGVIGPGGAEKDEEKAFELAQLSAEQENCYGQFLLARCYDKGKGGPEDKKQAVELYQLAADQQLPCAINELGECYYEGNGVEQDYEKALELFRAAAELGNLKAQYSMGHCYENGDGVEEDVSLAKIWYLRAAEGGHDGAREVFEMLQGGGMFDDE